MQLFYFHFFIKKNTVIKLGKLVLLLWGLTKMIKKSRGHCRSRALG